MVGALFMIAMFVGKNATPACGTFLDKRCKCNHFVGMLNMQTSLPVLVRERAVYYRERASYLYGSVPYALSSILVELPWLVLMVFTCESV